MTKLPAVMLYPSDWEGDEIAFCTLAAQGLWLRMMFLMHRSTRYGYLSLPNGSAIPSRVVAAKCGTTEQEYIILLAELDSVGKLSRTPEDVLYSRRMVRDEQKRASDRKRKENERGRKRDVTPHVTPVVTPHVTPLSGGSSASTTATEKKQVPSRDKREPDPRHTPFKLACEVYATHKRVEFVWDAGEAKQLAMLLAASPSLTLETFQRSLNHRAKSVVAHGDRPREWLGTILKYQEGPLDQFGKPQGVGNGTTQQNRPDAATDRQRTSQDNIRAAAIRRYGSGGDDGSSPSVQAEPGTAPRYSGPVPAGVGGDISTVRDGAFQGRTLEGIA